jgi:hypothetical protein
LRKTNPVFATGLAGHVPPAVAPVDGQRPAAGAVLDLDVHLCPRERGQAAEQQAGEQGGGADHAELLGGGPDVGPYAR